MERVLDVRGLRCPIPLVRARGALAQLAPGDELVVLATDPEARIDLAALAVDEDLTCAVESDGDGWRITLRR
jgi:tRNA 2-thiouridine synthesizing protein A